MRPLCDMLILVLILALKVPQGASVPHFLKIITHNGQKRQISDLFGGDERDRTADLLNASGFEVLDSMKFVRKLRQNSTI